MPQRIARTFEIYLIRNTVTGKVYVGQTTFGIDVRWKQHVNDSGKKITRLYSSVRKHGIENFSISLLARASSVSEMDFLETYFIVLYNSDDPECGYNMTSGGDINPTRCEAVRKAISQSRMGTPAHNKGKPLSAEQKAKISATRLRLNIPSPNKGQPFSMESRGRMSAAWTQERKAALAERNRKNGLTKKMLAARWPARNRKK